MMRWLNAFCDHFLTDAFAAGHLVNKRDVMEMLKSSLQIDPKGDFTVGSRRSSMPSPGIVFKGAVKTEFAKYKTVRGYGPLGLYQSIRRACLATAPGRAEGGTGRHCQ
jgi:hypothetical protein